MGSLTLGLLLLTAALYAALGQAGATGYLAIMGLTGVDAALMRPTALILNVIVAAIGVVQFARAGHFAWRVFWPVTALAIPFSFLGGAIILSPSVYLPLVGAVLVATGAKTLLPIKGAQTDSPLRLRIALPAGAVIGLLSGLTGTGGGVFLAPLLLSSRSLEVRGVASVTAAYNLVLSISAIIGLHWTSETTPDVPLSWMTAVAIGGLLGAWIGSKRLPERAVQIGLALVLIVAGLQMVLWR